MFTSMYENEIPERFYHKYKILRIKELFSKEEALQVLTTIESDLFKSFRVESAHYVGTKVYGIGYPYHTANENNTEKEYKKFFPKYNAAFDRYLPAYRDKVVSLMNRICDASYTPLENFSRPVFNVFYGSSITDNATGRHADIDKLSNDEIYSIGSAVHPFTVVVFLQMPLRGGSLSFTLPDKTFIKPVFNSGDAVVFDSRLLHNVEPFEKSFRRITGLFLFYKEPGNAYYWG